jgi:hypothetical protein
MSDVLEFDEIDHLLGNRTKKVVPCPLCSASRKPQNRKTPVLSLRREGDGGILFHCHHCGERGKRTIDGGSQTDRLASRMVAWERQPQAEQQDRSAYPYGIFRSAGPLTGTAGETYFNSRAILLEEVGSLHHAVRYAPMLMLDGKRVCGIVSLFRDIRTDEPKAIHRIFLHPDGQPVLDDAGNKIKKMLGPVTGAAIKLSPDDDVTEGLFIGEGVETTISGMIRGYRPAWALGSAGAIGSFPILPGVEAVSVFGERNKDGSLNRANIEAAEAVTDRYVAAAREAFFLDPPFGDFNDVLKKVSTQ